MCDSVMSDEDPVIDIESGDDDNYSISRQSSSGSSQSYSQVAKRAHHNALERKRRDQLKDSFSKLRDTIAPFSSEKIGSRVQILKSAAVHIDDTRKKTSRQQEVITEIRRQNDSLESQLHILTKAILSHPDVQSYEGSVAEILDFEDSDDSEEDSDNAKDDSDDSKEDSDDPEENSDDSETSESSESETELVVQHSKKLKTNWSH